jgi:hypothetical protein
MSVSVVVCDSAPDVAVIVTVDVVDFGTVWDGLAGESTPHPLSRPKPSITIISVDIDGSRRRFLHPMQHSAAASVAPGNGE